MIWKSKLEESEGKTRLTTARTASSWTEGEARSLSWIRTSLDMCRTPRVDEWARPNNNTDTENKVRKKNIRQDAMNAKMQSCRVDYVNM